jgi:hypothetical protein
MSLAKTLNIHRIGDLDLYRSCAASASISPCYHADATSKDITFDLRGNRSR